mgnify:CR=1 FL=1
MSGTLTKEEVLRRLRAERPYLAQKFGVTKLALYGSFARDAQTEKSDVDVLVALTRPLGLEFIALSYYLEDVVGRPVDLTTFDALDEGLKKERHRHIAADVHRSMIYV